MSWPGIYGQTELDTFVSLVACRKNFLIVINTIVKTDAIKPNTGGVTMIRRAVKCQYLYLAIFLDTGMGAGHFEPSLRCCMGVRGYVIGVPWAVVGHFRGGRGFLLPVFMLV